MGILLAQQGQLQEARGHFSKAVEINPNYADAQENLKKALRLMERKQ